MLKVSRTLDLLTLINKTFKETFFLHRGTLFTKTIKLE